MYIYIYYYSFRKKLIEYMTKLAIARETVRRETSLMVNENVFKSKEEFDFNQLLQRCS